MIIDKEYPATHSMSTSWYMIDDDGNVGIMGFGANGPIPRYVPENLSVNDLVLGNVLETDDFKPFNLTKSQILDMFEGPHTTSISVFDLEHLLVEIDKEQEDLFLSEIEKTPYECFCVNTDFGFYFGDFCDFDDDDETAIGLFNDLIEKRIIKATYNLKVPKANDTYANGTPHYEVRYNSMPYYLYSQAYRLDYPQKRIITPQEPVKEEQLSEYTRRSAIRIRGRFDDMPYMQIATQGYSTDFCRKTMLIGDFFYDLLPINEKEEAYCASETPIFKGLGERIQCKFFTTEPKLFILTDGIEIVKCYNFKCEYLEFVKQSFWFPYTPSSDREYIERLFEKYKPLAVLCLEDVIYTERDGNIVIGNSQYPLFKECELDSRKEELREVLNAPYRGAHVPLVISKAEMEELEKKGIAKGNDER